MNHGVNHTGVVRAQFSWEKLMRRGEREQQRGSAKGRELLNAGGMVLVSEEGRLKVGGQMSHSCSCLKVSWNSRM